MFGSKPAAPTGAVSLEPVTTQELEQLLARLAVPSPADGDTERVDRLSAMERVKNALCAAQASEAVDFDAAQREAQVAAGFAKERVGQGIAEQVALARMTSPWKGSRLLGLAKALQDLPECFAALQRGDASEWRMSGVLREIVHLDLEHRQLIDAELGPILGELGDREAADRARAMAQELDPVGAAARVAKAETERRVSIRPAPDCMAYVTALLPVRDGVAVYAALDRLAQDALAEQSPLDTRGKGALMADALVERVTGRARGTVPIRLALIMTDAALTGADDSPARVCNGGRGGSIIDGGVIPGGVARAWIRELLSSQVVSHEHLIAVNRLFTTPDGRDLVAMETTKTHYTGLLRRMLAFRDQRCRTPWCDAEVRDIDHIERRAQHGATSFQNGRGVCARCNQAREAPGWAAAVTSDRNGTHKATLTTPTGHHYPGTAPPLRPGHVPTTSGRTVPSRAGPQDTRAG